MSKIKIVAVVIVILAAIGVSAIALIANPAAVQQQNEGGEEVEDCDAEDFLNREDDCGFSEPKPARSSAVKATPKPRVTARR